jgi:tripartite-type tricarboxylate transporter receptor subunit TctC
MHRRVPIVACFVLGSLAFLGTMLSATTAGAAYPERPIRVIVGFVPGGTTDIVSRAITQEMSAQMGVSFIVENRPGATGQVGLEAMYRSAPDGYTLGLLASPTLISLQLAGKSLDPQKDLTGIGLIYRQGIFLASTLALPGWDGVKDMRDVVAKAKAAPGKLNYGSIGTGSTGHLVGEFLKTVAGVDWVHVPYKGQEPMTTALTSGEIHFVIGALPNNDMGGRVRQIGNTGAERDPRFPNLPAFGEIYPSAVAESWGSFAAPGGLPRDIADRLSKEMAAALKKPVVIETVTRAIAPPASMEGPELQKLIVGDYNRWGKVIRDNNIKVE